MCAGVEETRETEEIVSLSQVRNGKTRQSRGQLKPRPAPTKQKTFFKTKKRGNEKKKFIRRFMQTEWWLQLLNEIWPNYAIKTVQIESTNNIRREMKSGNVAHHFNFFPIHIRCKLIVISCSK